ncbi:hypothetical protein L2735_03705 [Shewanella olleyana]|uniref:hypothetical protein n=1 Tax=Shewanella olleyana TaxID=135626 RepID=UPI00200E2FCB|nr:hypothetical protein [Shewanella olleyana]MCL1065912.1 hypothetical protein [Shewanella olleyana]
MSQSIEANKHYDLHLMIIFMSLATALISGLGITTALIAEVSRLGVSPLSIRADTLGDYMTSPLAIVYNMGLVIGGACLMLSMLARYYVFEDFYSRTITITGALLGILIVLIGIFPINFLEQHRFFSTGYLICTFVLHSFCFIDYFRKNSSLSASLFGFNIIGLIFSVALMYLLNWSTLDFDPCTHGPNDICWVSLVMWALTQANILWCVLLGLNMKKLIKSQQKRLSNLAFASQ